MTHKKATPRKRTSRQPGDAEILDAEAAAVVLGIAKRTLLQMARKGEVPGKKLGRQWRFHRSTLRRWVAGDSEAESIVAALKKAGVKDVTLK
jgi:excisionase family DNA binding protein